MADVVTSIPISAVSYSTWLRTSYSGLGLVSAEGAEFGPDQEDAFNNFIDEASREILKLFVSRQGDASGVPFEQTSTNIIYRFREEEPVLPQAAGLKSILSEDVKNALYMYVTILWYKTKGNDKQISYLLDRYLMITDNIDNVLYKLHD